MARISIMVRFGESSMNSGASETSPILRASRAQSSSVILPLRMWCSGTFASAESSRMVISLRLISSEKTHEVRPCLIEAERAKSRPSVELWVGIMVLPARYRWSALSTSTQRTGTLATASIHSIRRSPSPASAVGKPWPVIWRGAEPGIAGVRPGLGRHGA